MTTTQASKLGALVNLRLSTRAHRRDGSYVSLWRGLNATGVPVFVVTDSRTGEELDATTMSTVSLAIFRETFALVAR